MKCNVLTPNLMHRYGASSILDVVEVPDAIAADLIAQGTAREPKGAKGHGASEAEKQTGKTGDESGAGRAGAGKAGVKPPKG